MARQRVRLRELDWLALGPAKRDAPVQGAADPGQAAKHSPSRSAAFVRDASAGAGRQPARCYGNARAQPSIADAQYLHSRLAGTSARRRCEDQRTPGHFLLTLAADSLFDRTDGYCPLRIGALAPAAVAAFIRDPVEWTLQDVRSMFRLPLPQRKRSTNTVLKTGLLATVLSSDRLLTGRRGPSDDRLEATHSRPVVVTAMGGRGLGSSVGGDCAGRSRRWRRRRSGQRVRHGRWCRGFRY